MEVCRRERESRLLNSASKQHFVWLLGGENWPKWKEMRKQSNHGLIKQHALPRRTCELVK